MDKPLLFLTLFMIGYGLLNIVTASSREAVNQDVPLYHYFYRQSEMLAIALFLSMFIISLNTRKYKWLSLISFVIIFAILGYLFLNGSTHRGSKNWIEIMGVRFQPSEFAKPVLIVCVSLLFEKFYYRFRDKQNNHYDVIISILFVGCIFPFIVFLQKDFGTGIILFGIFGILFLSSPILKIDKLKTIVIVLLLSLFGILFSKATGKSILTEEQKDRFNFFNPCSNYEQGGYQVCNGMIAINDGGLFGVGIGKSKQKYSYIPEPHTDSVFSIIMEEYGLLFCTILFVIYILILQRILMISSKATTLRGRYITLGVAIYIFLHILINLGGLFGLMPLTGVPLPFLSYGGSFTISLICSLALVQRINIENRNEKIKI